MPDSDENRAHFGGQSAGTRERGPSAHPMVRLAALGVTVAHSGLGVLRRVRQRRFHYAADLGRFVSDSSRLIAARLFFTAVVVIPVARDGHNRHWLTRAKANANWRKVERLGSGGVWRLDRPGRTLLFQPFMCALGLERLEAYTARRCGGGGLNSSDVGHDQTCSS